MVTMGHRRLAWLVAPMAVALGLMVGCAGDDLDLTDAGRAGQDVAKDAGCAACHGGTGNGGVGPAWAGLYGADVELADGRVVVADDEYLRRSIRDPQADIVAGYTLQMPENNLSDAQIDAVLTYIRELQ